MYPYVYQLSDSELGHHFVYPPIKSNVAMEIPYNRGFELVNHLETMDFPASHVVFITGW